MRTTIVSSASYKFLAALAVIAMVLAALPVMPAYAANISVNTLTDEITANGSCSLREAIINANDDAATRPDCTPGSGADVITLQSGSTYTLSLTGTSSSGGDLDILDPDGLTIAASSTSLATINAGDIDRVFDVTAGDLTFSYIAVTNGTESNGAGINFGSTGTLTLNNSAVSGNTGSSGTGCGAGIFTNSTGTININNSTFQNNACATLGADGGGIYKGVLSSGTLNITGSTFSTNSAADNGGGVQASAGTVNITNSTFFNNSAGEKGGGVQVGGATVTIEFSTFSQNSATSAGVNKGGAIQVSSGTAAINRSILANSTGNDCDQTTGSGTATITNSLVEAIGDCAGTPTSTADPGLGALANNGGTTQTMAITASSPAYNAAASCPITTDQRGVARPQSTACDLGAFEFDGTTGAAPTVVSIVRASPNPTSASSVQYTVTFSESVNGVGTSDFALTTTGAITSPQVSGVTGSGATRTVTVNTGNGSGTLRLDVRSDATIFDADSNNLANIPFTSGEAYTVIKGSVWHISTVGAVAFGESGDIPVPGDYNGDNRDDVAVYRPSNGTWYISTLGNFGFGEANDIPVPGDYNGDGRDDVAVYRPSDRIWYISTLGNFQYGETGDIPVPGDYNGDGRDDIAVYRPSNGTWYISTRGNIPFGMSGDRPLPGDYNGDSVDDIAVYRPSSGFWYISTRGNFQYGEASDIPLPGDYNGDGLDDIAVYRPSDRTWYISTLGNFQYGETGDLPIPGDYNGDDRDDIAIYRP